MKTYFYSVLADPYLEIWQQTGNNLCCITNVRDKYPHKELQLLSVG